MQHPSEPSNGHSSAPASPRSPAAGAPLFDCIVVGGGPAGLAAALILGRAQRRVAVFDSGEKRNEASTVQHAILGADGHSRGEFLELARAQVLSYPTVEHHCLAVCDVDVRANEVQPAGEADGCALTNGKCITDTDRFIVHTEDGRQWKAKKVILATGVRDLLPDVEGFETYWGHGVWVCLYCDAYEYRGQALAAYGNGERGVHIALEMLLWSKDITLFTDGQLLEATELERQLLEKHGVRVIEARIARAVGGKGGELAGLVLCDGCIVPVKGLFFNTGRVQTSRLPQRMGLPADDRGDILCEVKGNVKAIHGLFVAGNMACAPLKLVQTAASQGAVTGARVNTELLYEELGLDEDEGDRYICSLDGTHTSAAACQWLYSADRRKARPTGDGVKEVVQQQQGAGGAGLGAEPEP